MAYNLLINGVHWGYNPITNLFTIFPGHASKRKVQKSVDCLSHMIATVLVGGGGEDH